MRGGALLAVLAVAASETSPAPSPGECGGAPRGRCQAFNSGFADGSTVNTSYPKRNKYCYSGCRCAVPGYQNSACMPNWDTDDCINWDTAGPGAKHQAVCGQTLQPAHLSSCKVWSEERAFNNGYQVNGDMPMGKAHAIYCAKRVQEDGRYNRHSRWPAGSKGQCFFGLARGVQKMKGPNGDWYYECGCTQMACTPRNTKAVIWGGGTIPKQWRTCPGTDVPKNVVCRTTGARLACFCPGHGKDATNPDDWDDTCDCMHGKAHVRKSECANAPAPPPQTAAEGTSSVVEAARTLTSQVVTTLSRDNAANCQDATKSATKKCWNSIRWIKSTGLNNPGKATKYIAAGLTKQSSDADIQKYLFESEPKQKCPRPCKTSSNSRKLLQGESSENPHIVVQKPAWPTGMKDCDWWADKVEAMADNSPLGITKWCANEAKKSNSPNWKYVFQRSAANATFTLRHGLQAFKLGHNDKHGEMHKAVVCSCKQTTCNANGECWSKAFVAGCYHSKHSCFAYGGCSTAKSDMTDVQNWCPSCGNAMNELAHAG